MIIDIVLAYAQGRGGLEEVLTNVTNELVNRGHRVRLFQAYKPEYLEWIDTIPEIHFYGLNSSLKEDDLFSLAVGYRKMIDNMGMPDIVIATHAPSLSLVCRLALQHLGEDTSSIISWIHGTPEYYGNGQFLKYSDAHLAISTDIGNRINNCIDNNNPIYYIGNPVCMTDFNNIKQSKDELKLLYIGRLDNYQKRLDVLFNSLRLLSKPWKLKIVGNGQDRKKLKKLSLKLGIDKNIEWCGWLEKPWLNVEEASALVLSSDDEGFGLVLVEALGRGIPVITSNCSGPMDIVENNKNGWIFNKGDYNELANILKDIQNGNKELPSSQTCIDSVSKFEVSNVIDKIEDISLKYYKYENIIANLTY